jgi:hypothetical protein
LYPVGTGHHQEVKYSSASPNVQKKLTRAKTLRRKESPFASLRLCEKRKKSSATADEKKNLTLPPRRTGCKAGKAQRFCLRQADQLIDLRVFSADICVNFFSVLDLR